MGAADRARARLVDRMRDGVLRNAAGGGVLRDATGRGGCLLGRAIEEAFLAVPRHLFLPGVPLSHAYADDAVATQSVDGVTTSSASQPSMMALMLAQLDLRPGHRVLEIGAGTGYNAALMARLVEPGGQVVAVDIDPELVEGAARHLSAAGVTGVELHCADGALGHAPGAPYDRIVLTVGSGDVRPEWVAQLAPGGRLLLPLAVRGMQLSVAFDLGPDGLLRSDSVHRCSFVRLRGVGAVAESGGDVGGLSVLPGDERSVRPAAVRAALAAPGASRSSPVPLTPADGWNGFGPWLVLTDAGACRLVARRGGPHDATVDLLGLAPGQATVGLVTDGPGGSGLAAVLLDRSAGPQAPRPIQVRAFGPDGDAAADRLLAAVARWQAAGRPTTGELRLTVVPRGGAAPPAPAGSTVVEKEHCRVVVGPVTS